MLFERVGVEWARNLTHEDADVSGSIGPDIEAVLTAPPEEFAEAARRLVAEIYLAQGPLLKMACAVILSSGTTVRSRGAVARWAEVERIGRALIMTEHFAGQAGAAGHFLAGQALWSRWACEEGTRHFQLAHHTYQGLMLPIPQALSRLAAAATSAASLDAGFPERLQRAFSELAIVDEERAQRLLPAVDHDLAVYRAASDATSEGAIPTSLPETLTEADLQLLRSAVARSVVRPERAVAIARWIQSLRGLADDETEELDFLVLLLESVRQWDSLILVLRDMVAHGDQRLQTISQLARALAVTGRWPEAKSLLTARVDESRETRRVEVLQRLVMLGTVEHDPGCGRWMAELRALGGELPGFALPSPMMGAETAAEPELLARFSDGALTIDPRLVVGGEGAIDAHITAAIVLGRGPREGREMLDSIAARDPEFYRAVIELLPRHVRPRPEAEEAVVRASRLQQQGDYRAAIAEYQEAIRLDPKSLFAHFGLGNAYFMLGGYQVAIAHLTESIAIRPTAQAHLILGGAIRDSGGDLRQAERCYEEALAMDPAYADARAGLEDVRRRLAANIQHRYGRSEG